MCEVARKLDFAFLSSFAQQVSQESSGDEGVLRDVLIFAGDEKVRFELSQSCGLWLYLFAFRVCDG